MTDTGHHTATPDVLTLPLPNFLIPLWLKEHQDGNGVNRVTVNIAGGPGEVDTVDLHRLTADGSLALTEYVLGKLFDDPNDVYDPDCESVTVLADGTVQVVISFDASEFIDNHICGTEGCDGDADSGDSYDGYCADCADELYGHDDN